MIDFRIMGVPSRMDNIRLLQQQLGITDASVFLDTEYRKNPMWTWKQTARLNDQTTKQPNDQTTNLLNDHLCIVQDDAVLPERFTEFCEYLVRRFPDAIFTLYNRNDFRPRLPLGCIFTPNYCTGVGNIFFQ